MTTIEFARVVKDMRDTQKAYFRERTGSLLDESRRKERMVDTLVKGIIDDKPSMLPGMEEEP